MIQLYHQIVIYDLEKIFWIYIKIITTDNKINDEKYEINREAAKISALSSGKVNKYEYLAGEEILPCNQKQIMKQAKFTYSPLGKAFGIQTKTIEDQGRKQIDPIQNQGQAKAIKKYTYNDKDSLLISKQIINLKMKELKLLPLVI